MEVELKVYSEWFEKIASGEKKFELRLGDKNINEGDVLILREIDENRAFTGRELKKNVNGVIRTKDLNYWSDEEINKEGFVIASFD